MSKPDELAEVGNFLSVSMAQPIVELLRSEGIEAVISGPTSVSSILGLAQRASVLVPLPDASRAKHIMAAAETPELPEPVDLPVESPRADEVVQKAKPKPAEHAKEEEAAGHVIAKMKCPNCGLINPPEAQVCDCGFALERRKTGTKSRSDSTLNKDLVEFVALLVILGAAHLFFATPFDAVVKRDIRKSSDPLLRSVLFDPTLKDIGYEKLTQLIDVSSLGLRTIGKGEVRFEPPFIILTLVHWGSFLDERHMVDGEFEIRQSVNWTLVGIEAALGLVIAFIPLFKRPAKLARAFLHAND